jgi:hypothetical protein
MSARPHFIAELWRRQPAGLALGAFALLSVGVIFYCVSAKIGGRWLFPLGVASVIAMALGMHLTHRAAFTLQQERRAQDSARSPAPWEL